MINRKNSYDKLQCLRRLFEIVRGKDERNVMFLVDKGDTRNTQGNPRFSEKYSLVIMSDTKRRGPDGPSLKLVARLADAR